MQVVPYSTWVPTWQSPQTPLWVIALFQYGQPGTVLSWMPHTWEQTCQRSWSMSLEAPSGGRHQGSPANNTTNVQLPKYNSCFPCKVLNKKRTDVKVHLVVGWRREHPAGELRHWLWDLTDWRRERASPGVWWALASNGVIVFKTVECERKIQETLWVRGSQPIGVMSDCVIICRYYDEYPAGLSAKSQ